MAHTCCYGISLDYFRTLCDDGPGNDNVVDIPGDLFENAVRIAYGGRYRWSGKTLRPCEDLARSVLLACQGVPMSYSSSRPNCSSTYVACRPCSVPGQALLVMHWQAAVSTSARCPAMFASSLVWPL